MERTDMNATQVFKHARLYKGKKDQKGGGYASDVVRFWREAHENWFSHDPAFDHKFKQRFFALHLLVAQRCCDDWADTPEGMLALLILLDQFPRNACQTLCSHGAVGWTYGGG
jgi:uncharacterized protein (DUF924 family)